MADFRGTVFELLPLTPEEWRWWIQGLTSTFAIEGIEIREERAMAAIERALRKPLVEL